MIQKNSTICYILPSRSRPAKFFSVLDNIVNFSAKEDYLIIATLDVDDISMNNLETIIKMGGYKNITYVFGKSTGKVDAINKNLDLIPEDTGIIVLMSDDMVFTQWGFDDIIRTDMQKYFPDTDGVLHYPDGTPVQDKIITMSIMGYRYFKRFNYLYHPEYVSLWCDLEFTEVAKKLGKHKYLPNTHILKHVHPVWSGGKEKYDALMTKNESYYHYDKAIYFKRLEKNFDLK